MNNVRRKNLSVGKPNGRAKLTGTLKSKASAQGYLTADDIAQAFPGMEDEQLVDLFASMQEAGIEMREAKGKARRRGRRLNEDEFDLSTISSDDTVGLYLKEMARV